MATPVLTERVSDIDFTPESVRRVLAEMSDTMSNLILKSGNTALQEGRGVHRLHVDFHLRPERVKNLESWVPKRVGSHIPLRKIRVTRDKETWRISPRSPDPEDGFPEITFRGAAPKGKVEWARHATISVSAGGRIAAIDLHYPVSSQPVDSWILQPFVLETAFKYVQAGGPAPGVDKLRPSRAKKSMIWDLLKNVRAGKFDADPLRLVLIPKKNGKVRPLNIPTVKDRVFQTAMVLVLNPILERKFLDVSYGFRPRKNTYHAVTALCRHLEAGYRWAVALDLKDYYETIPFDVVRQIVIEDTRSEILADWIIAQCDNKSLLDVRTSRIMMGLAEGAALPMPWNQYVGEGGGESKPILRKIGVPQGGPVSPLLANAVLHRFDDWCRKKGYRIVRYADDTTMVAKTKAAAEKMYARAIEYLEGDLRLIVNREKTQIIDTHSGVLTVLGFDLVKGRIEPSAKNLDACKANIEEILESGVMKDINHAMECAWCWGKYFSRASGEDSLLGLEEWLDSRLRQVHPHARPSRLKERLEAEQLGRSVTVT
jgi:RNA-directed DNA polymerase